MFHEHLFLGARCGENLPYRINDLQGRPEMGFWAGMPQLLV
jgi:hypothetical protein